VRPRPSANAHGHGTKAVVVLSTDRETIVIRLELHLVEGSLTGRASTASAPAREFAGWLGLLAAIDGLISSHEREHDR
jgi:hypothetical protein